MDSVPTNAKYVYEDKEIHNGFFYEKEYNIKDKRVAGSMLNKFFYRKELINTKNRLYRYKLIKIVDYIYHKEDEDPNHRFSRGGSIYYKFYDFERGKIMSSHDDHMTGSNWGSSITFYVFTEDAIDYLDFINKNGYSSLVGGRRRKSSRGKTSRRRTNRRRKIRR
jgi:hypothetical protein